jgi:hypothetical protein
MVLETIGTGVLLYWAGTGVASGALQLARGAALAAGALAEADVAVSVRAIGRAAAPIVITRNGQPVCS